MPNFKYLIAGVTLVFWLVVPAISGWKMTLPVCCRKNSRFGHSCWQAPNIFHQLFGFEPSLTTLLPFWANLKHIYYGLNIPFVMLKHHPYLSTPPRPPPEIICKIISRGLIVFSLANDNTLLMVKKNPTMNPPPHYRQGEPSSKLLHPPEG